MDRSRRLILCLAFVALALAGCSGMMEALRSSGEGAVVAGAAAGGGAAGGPLGAALAAIFAFFGVKIAREDAEAAELADQVEKLQRKAGELESGLGIGGYIELGLAALGAVALLLVLWNVFLARGRDQLQGRLAELEEKIQRDLDGDGEIGSGSGS